MTRALLSSCLWIGLAVAACTAPRVDDGPAVPPPQADTCGAAPHADLIGADARALERELILRQVRVIRPGQAVTMDYREERLNFWIAPDGTIRRISCG